MRDRIRNITVSTNDKFVIWEVDLSGVERDTVLSVENGCVAHYIVDGVLKNVNLPGRWYVKSREEDRRGCALKLICANTDKTFSIKCGVGDVPFKDDEINYETAVGARGECRIRIGQVWSLYLAMGKANVTAADIEAYVKLKLNEHMISRLAEVLQHYDYGTIMTQQSKISDDLKKKLSDTLMDIGIEVESFALAGIYFNEEYQNRRKDFFEAENRKKAEKEERRIREREQRMEVDNVIAIANAARAANVNNPVNQAPVNQAPVQNNVNEVVRYCPRCGAKLVQDFAFCPSCGKPLSKN